MKRISALLGGAVFGVALLAACGGGGGSGTSSPGGPLPGTTPAPGQTTVPQSFSSSDAVAVPTPGVAAAPVALTSDASGASVNAAIPPGASVPADTTVAATYSSAGDSSLPALSIRRAVSSVRGLRAEDGHKTIIAYLKLQFSADVTLPQAPAFTFVVPGTLPTANTSYWLAFIDPLRSAAGWQAGFEGPATVTPTTTNSGKPGTQLAFASNGKPLTFVANQTYYFAVYAVSATVATPTPVPSTVPTNPPPENHPGPVTASPANVQFPAVTSSPVAVTFSQQGFTGPFTLHGDCTGIVNTGGTSPTWTITPVGQGRCVIVGLGQRGATAVVHIGVVTPFETPRPSPTPHPSTSPGTSPSPHPSESPHPEPSESAHPEPSHSPTSAPSVTPSPSHSPEATPTPTPTATPTPGTNPTK
jgi:hypothetical protein